MTKHERFEALQDKEAKILFMRYSSLGDIVLSTRFAAALARRCPGWDITWLSEAPYQELLASQPYVRHTIPWDRKDGLRGYTQIITGVRRMGFDALVDAQCSDRSVLFSLLSGIPLRCGAHRHWGFIYHYPIDNLFRGAGIYRWDRQPYMEPPGVPLPADLAGVGPSVVLAVGTSKAKKTWPAARMGELCARLAACDYTPVLVGHGAGEEEAARTIQHACPSAVSLVARLSLVELVRVLACPAAVVSGDTGALHIAKALGTPCVGLFGPTRLNAEYTDTLNYAIFAACEKIGCLDWNCERPCMDTIAPQTVLDAVMAVRRF